jgi:hypothetical protein
MEPRNRFQGINHASLCSLAGRYDTPIPTRFLAPTEASSPQKINPGMIQHFKNKTFLHFSVLWVIFDHQDPDPDPPDHNQCGSGSTTLLLSTHSLQLFHTTLSCLPHSAIYFQLPTISFLLSLFLFKGPLRIFPTRFPHSNHQSVLEFLNNLWGARNRVGIGLSNHRPAGLHRLAELIPWDRFLGSLKV